MEKNIAVILDGNITVSEHEWLSPKGGNETTALSPVFSFTKHNEADVKLAAHCEHFFSREFLSGNFSNTKIKPLSKLPARVPEWAHLFYHRLRARFFHL